MLNVPLIYELEGEAGFRAREKILTAELVQGRGRLSCWQQVGGVAVDPANRRNHAKGGTTKVNYLFLYLSYAGNVRC